MHISSVVTASVLYFSMAFAAPSTPPLSRRQNSTIPNPLEPGCLLNQPKEREMCTTNKTPQQWTELGIGEWLQVMTIGEHPFKKGLYETVRDRNKKLHDTKCGENISPDGLVAFGDCDDLTDEPTCFCQPYAYFALSAMHNFVNYMEKLRSAISTAGSIVGYQVLSMPKQYNPTGNSDDPIELVGGVMGILGTLAGAVPPLSDLGIGFGLVSGILGMVGGAKDETDPLAPVAEISSHLGHQVSAMMAAVATYTHHLLYDIPTDAKDDQGYTTVYTDDPKEMVAVLGTKGAWVDEPGPIDGKMIARSLAAPAINALWNNEFVVVIKVSNKDNILGVDPCKSEEIFKDNMKHCDKDGNMYVVRKWKGDGGFDWDKTDGMDVPGWKNATQEYGFTVKTIALSSEANQNGAKAYKPKPPSPSDFASHFLTKDFGHLQDEDMVYFNFPVCDVNNAPMLDDTIYKACGTATCRFNQLMLCRCAGRYFDEWASWPYNNNMALGRFPYDVTVKTCQGS